MLGYKCYLFFSLSVESEDEKQKVSTKYNKIVIKKKRIPVSGDVVGKDVGGPDGSLPIY